MTLLFTNNVRASAFVEFDATYDCEIETQERINTEMESEGVGAWIKVSCKTRITDRIERFEVTNIEVYTREARRNNENRTTADFVPIISRNQLESEAEDSLITYCVEVLERPMRVPIENIVRNKLKLNVVRDYRLSPDFSVFGMLGFNTGNISVYNDNNEETIIRIDGPTVFIDPNVYFLRNIGCANNTIAHEAYHWHKHRLYTTVKTLLDRATLVVSKCVAEPDVDEIKDSIQSDEDWMEWQANWIAPKILMPMRTAKIKAKELALQYGYSNTTPARLDIMKTIIDELALFYDVSKQAARIRMMDMGYDDAKLIYNYNMTRPSMTNSISPSDALCEYVTNRSFRELVDTGVFAYVDGHFVIDDDKYIDRSGDEPCLTLEGHENLHRIAIQFIDKKTSDYCKWEYIITPHESMYRRAGKRDDRNIYRESLQSSEFSDEVKRVSEDIDASYDAQATTRETFCETLSKILMEQNISYTDFEDMTLYNRDNYYKIKNGTLKPRIDMVVGICVGLRLDWDTSESLIHRAGLSFNTSKLHHAYRFLLTFQSHKGIDFCNSVLKDNGFPPLGSKERD